MKSNSIFTAHRYPYASIYLSGIICAAGWSLSMAQIKISIQHLHHIASNSKYLFWYSIPTVSVCEMVRRPSFTFAHFKFSLEMHTSNALKIRWLSVAAEFYVVCEQFHMPFTPLGRVIKSKIDLFVPVRRYFSLSLVVNSSITRYFNRKNRRDIIYIFHSVIKKNKNV